MREPNPMPMGKENYTECVHDLTYTEPSESFDKNLVGDYVLTLMKIATCSKCSFVSPVLVKNIGYWKKIPWII